MHVTRQNKDGSLPRIDVNPSTVSVKHTDGVSNDRFATHTPAFDSLAQSVLARRVQVCILNERLAQKKIRGTFHQTKEWVNFATARLNDVHLGSRRRRQPNCPRNTTTLHLLSGNIVLPPAISINPLVRNKTSKLANMLSQWPRTRSIYRQDQHEH